MNDLLYIAGPALAHISSKNPPLLIFAVALAVSACEPYPALSAGEIARVDDHTITRDNLQQRFWQGPIEIRQRALKRGGRHFLLDLVIDEHLLQREAERLELAPSFSLVHPFHEKLMRQFLQAEFDPQLRPSDVTMAQLDAEYERMLPELETPPRRSFMVLQAETEAHAAEIRQRAELALGENGEEGLLELFHEQEGAGLIPQKGLFEQGHAETYLGKAITDSAFSLTMETPISQKNLPYQGKLAVVVLLAELDPPPLPSLQKIERQVRGRVYQRLREAALNEFVETFRDEHDVRIRENNLDLIPWVPEREEQQDANERP